MDIYQKIGNLYTEVREHNPLIHHITNYVTANECANIVLALGGSPVMADDIHEVAEMVSISSALVLNLGTLNYANLETMLLAGAKANHLNIPVILDPVGVGSTSFRNKAAQTLVKNIQFAIIRGNTSEIMAVAGIEVHTRGVDSTREFAEGKRVAINLAKRLKSVVAVTGAKDLITDGEHSLICENGHPLLSRVTGTGCMVSSLVGVYAGISTDKLLAATAGIVSMGIAGEKAFQQLQSTDHLGTFRIKLFDQIGSLSTEDFIKWGRLNEL